MSRPRFPTPVTILAALPLVLAACTSTSAPPSPTATATATATPEPDPTASPTDQETAEPAPSEEEPDDVNVDVQGSRYDPAELTIPAGTQVIFLNADPFAHTVTEGTGGRAADDPIIDAEIDQNESASVTFDEPGTYEITCRFHPTMRMTITVEG